MVQPTTVGLDIAKNVFQAYGVDAQGQNISVSLGVSMTAAARNNRVLSVSIFILRGAHLPYAEFQEGVAVEIACNTI